MWGYDYWVLEREGGMAIVDQDSPNDWYTAGLDGCMSCFNLDTIQEC